MYLKCPLCEQVMNRKQFARGAKVVLDVCRGHGAWFDRGELSRTVDFVMKGGLDAAAKADLRDLQEDARRVRADALYAQAQAPRSSWEHREQFSTTVSLVDILASFWR